MEDSPFWEVPLKEPMLVATIMVTAAGEPVEKVGGSLSDFNIYVGGDSDTGGAKQVCAVRVQIQRGETKEVTCTIPTWGVSIRIELPRRGSLSVCEVDVRSAMCRSADQAHVTVAHLPVCGWKDLAGEVAALQKACAPNPDCGGFRADLHGMGGSVPLNTHPHSHTRSTLPKMWHKFLFAGDLVPALDARCT